MYLISFLVSCNEYAYLNYISYIIICIFELYIIIYRFVFLLLVFYSNFDQVDVSLKKTGSVRIITYIIGIVLFQPIDARGLFFLTLKIDIFLCSILVLFKCVRMLNSCLSSLGFHNQSKLAICDTTLTIHS